MKRLRYNIKIIIIYLLNNILNNKSEETYAINYLSNYWKYIFGMGHYLPKFQGISFRFDSKYIYRCKKKEYNQITPNKSTNCYWFDLCNYRVINFHPSVHKLLQKCILFRNTLFIILFLIVIVFFSIGIILLIPKFYKKEIERVINVRKDGEIWIEDNSKLQNGQEAKNNDSSQETNTSTKEFDDDQLPNIPLKNKKKSFKRRPIIICFLVAFFILLLCAWQFIRVLQKYRCLESQIQQLIYLNQKINEIDNKLINHEITINDDLIFIRKEFLEEKNTIVNELSRTNYKTVTEIEK